MSGNQKYYSVVGNPEGNVAARIGELAHSDKDIWYVKKYYDSTNVGWEIIDIKSFFTQTPTPTQTLTPTTTPTFTPTSTPTQTPTLTGTQVTVTPTPTPTPTPTVGGALGGVCFSGWSPFVNSYFFNPTAKIIGVNSGAVRSGSMQIFGINYPVDAYGFDSDSGKVLGNYLTFIDGEDVVFSGMTGIYVRNGIYKVVNTKIVPSQPSSNFKTIACSTTVTAPRVLNISPAVNGKITWNLDVDGPLLVQGYNTWNISPALNGFYVNCEVVGAAGGQGGADVEPGGARGFGSKTIGAFTLGGPCILIGSNMGENGVTGTGAGGGIGGVGYYSGGNGGNAGGSSGGYSGGGGGGGGASAILNGNTTLLFASGGGGGGGGGGWYSAGGDGAWSVQTFSFSNGTSGESHLSDGGGGGGGGACGGYGGGVAIEDDGGTAGTNGAGFAGTTISSEYNGHGYIVIS
jgi:hypothetical protein